MCAFCAAIPVAAATGAAANRKQQQAANEARAAGVEDPKTKPIGRITAGIVLALLACSITYHSVTKLPLF